MKKQEWGLASTPDRTIETVFKAVEPYKALENGFGYQGVLLRDTQNDLLQCHICGVWKSGLAHHLRLHKITADQYREKFELPVSCPLMNNKMLNRLSELGRSKEWKERLKKATRNTTMHKNLHKRKWRSYKRLSHENKYGTCPEQLVRRYLIVADRIGHEPSDNELRKYDHAAYAAISHKYGTNKWRAKNNFLINRIQKIDYTPDKIIAQIQKLADRLGRVPRWNDLVKSTKDTPTICTIRKHLGSFHRAMILSGFNHSRYQ